MNRAELSFHEWAAVIVIMAMIAALISITLFRPNSNYQVGSPHIVAPQEIEVTVEGMVENPGTFQLKKGARVKDALALAKPLPEANLDRLNLEARLRDGRKIKVVAKKTKPQRQRATENKTKKQDTQDIQDKGTG